MRNGLITCLVACLCLQLAGTKDARSQAPQSSPQTPGQTTRQAETTACNGILIFPYRPGGAVVTLELVNQLRDEVP